MSFCEDLRKYKEENHLSYAEVAEKLGTVPSQAFNFIARHREPSNKKIIDKFYSFYKPEEKVVANSLSKPQEKVIIAGIDELLEAFKNGESVYDDTLQKFYRMIDGYICCFTQNSKSIVSFKTPVLLNNEIYVLREKKIIVEVGKTYLTDEGEKVVVVSDNTAFKLGSAEPITIDIHGEPLNIVREA